MNDRYHILTTVLAVIGAIAAILLAIWAIYLFFAPKYYIGYDEEAGEESGPDEEFDRDDEPEGAEVE